MYVQLKIIIHDKWLIPQIWKVVRRLEGEVEVLEEVVRRQGEEIRRLKERPPQEKPQEGEVSHRNKK